MNMLREMKGKKARAWVKQSNKKITLREELRKHPTVRNHRLLFTKYKGEC